MHYNMYELNGAESAINSLPSDFNQVVPLTATYFSKLFPKWMVLQNYVQCANNRTVTNISRIVYSTTILKNAIRRKWSTGELTSSCIHRTTCISLILNFGKYLPVGDAVNVAVYTTWSPQDVKTPFGICILWFLELSSFNTRFQMNPKWVDAFWINNIKS